MIAFFSEFLEIYYGLSFCITFTNIRFFALCTDNRLYDAWIDHILRQSNIVQVHHTAFCHWNSIGLSKFNLFLLIHQLCNFSLLSINGGQQKVFLQSIKVQINFFCCPIRVWNNNRLFFLILKGIQKELDNFVVRFNHPRFSPIFRFSDKTMLCALADNNAIRFDSIYTKTTGQTQPVVMISSN